jgi:hypothetical protein
MALKTGFFIGSDGVCMREMRVILPDLCDALGFWAQKGGVLKNEIINIGDSVISHLFDTPLIKNDISIIIIA